MQSRYIQPRTFDITREVQYQVIGLIGLGRHQLADHPWLLNRDTSQISDANAQRKREQLFALNRARQTDSNRQIYVLIANFLYPVRYRFPVETHLRHAMRCEILLLTQHVGQSRVVEKWMALGIDGHADFSDVVFESRHRV